MGSSVQVPYWVDHSRIMRSKSNRPRLEHRSVLGESYYNTYYALTQILRAHDCNEIIPRK